MMNLSILTVLIAFLFTSSHAAEVAPLPLITKISPDDAVATILMKRYSGYVYDPVKNISPNTLKTILEAGRLAPSSYNEQPWVFIVCDRSKDPAAYQKVFNALVEFNQGWAKNAPVLIVSVASSKSAHNGKINRHAQYDTGAAAFSMMLEATSLGLMAHQMGGFDDEKLRKSFAIPADYVPMAVMAIGYPGKEEVPAKNRKPLKENFFEGAWGRGIE